MSTRDEEEEAEDKQAKDEHIFVVTKYHSTNAYLISLSKSINTINDKLYCIPFPIVEQTTYYITMSFGRCSM